MWSHFVSTNLGNIPSQHAIIQSIEHKQQAHIHPRTGFSVKHQIQTEERRHHYDVADNTENVTKFVQEVKPFVDQSGIT